MARSVDWAVDCPKCDRPNRAGERRCAACGRGRIVATTVYAKDGVRVAHRCDACLADVARIDCGGCGLDLTPLIVADVGRRLRWPLAVRIIVLALVAVGVAVGALVVAIDKFGG